MQGPLVLACFVLFQCCQGQGLGLVPIRGGAQQESPGDVYGEPVPKIVGGQDSERGEAPHVAVINSAGKICGGSVIGRRFILTILYCVIDNINDLDNINIFVGMDNLDTDLPDAQFTKAQSIFHVNQTAFPLFDPVVIRTTDVLRLGSKYIGAKDIADADILKAIKTKDRRCFVYNRGLGRTDDGVYEPNRQMKKLSLRYTRCKNVFAEEYPYNLPEFSCIKSVDRDSYLAGWDVGSSVVCRQHGKWYLTSLTFYADPRDAYTAGRSSVIDLDIFSQRIQDIIDNN